MGVLEDIRAAIAAIENEPYRPRCEHLVSYSQRERMREASDDGTGICPWCGSRVRLG